MHSKTVPVPKQAKGGRARAEALTPGERSRIAKKGATALNESMSPAARKASAKKAAAARWKK
jgi:hypothetical protein